MVLLHAVLLLLAAVCFLLAALAQPARINWEPLGLLVVTIDVLARLGGL